MSLFPGGVQIFSIYQGVMAASCDLNGLATLWNYLTLSDDSVVPASWHFKLWHIEPEIPTHRLPVEPKLWAAPGTDFRPTTLGHLTLMPPTLSDGITRYLLV